MSNPKNNIKQYEFWDGVSSPVFVAHRGGDKAGLEKENSLLAFQEAYNDGYKWLETDVVPTKDDVLLAIHGRGYQLHPNKDLPRRMALQRMTYEEVQAKLFIGGEPPVTLGQLLDNFPDARIFVDPKTYKSARVLGEVLLERDPKDLARICIGAFSRRRTNMVIQKVKQEVGITVCSSLLGPLSACVIWLASKYSLFDGLAKKYVKNSGAASVHVPYKWLTASDERGTQFVDYCHQLGLRVGVYTPNDEESLKQSVARGADIIMSDNIMLMSKVQVK